MLWRSVGLRGAALVLVGLYTWLLVRTAWIGDDAYITFRALENFLHGYGPVFNVGERVQVFTHPLWFLIQAAANAVVGLWRNNPFGNAQLFFLNLLFSIGLSFLVVFLLAGWTATTARGALLAVATLVLSKAYLDYSTSGLENPLTHLLLLLFATVYLSPAPFDAVARAAASGSGELAEEDARDRAIAGYTRTWEGRRIAALSVLAGLGALDRLDTLLLYLPALAYAVWRSVKPRAALGRAFLGFLPLVTWELFSLFYYGAPFPNTAYAKINTGIPVTDLARQAMHYFGNSLRLDPITLVVILLTCVAAILGRSAPLRPVAAGVLLYLLYTMLIGGDFMSGRYFSAPLLVCAVLVARAKWGPRPRLALSAIALLAVGLAPMALVPERRPDFGVGSAVGHRIYDDGHGISDERRVYAGLTLLNALSEGPPEVHAASERWVYVPTSPVDVRLIGPLGMRGYVLGPNVHVIDLNSLADPLMPRLPLYETEHWRVGHFRHVIPEGYKETLATGVNQILDPDIASYYDHLRLVVRGPLWTLERISEIWRLNTGRYDHLLGP